MCSCRLALLPAWPCCEDTLFLQPQLMSLLLLVLLQRPPFSTHTSTRIGVAPITSATTCVASARRRGYVFEIPQASFNLMSRPFTRSRSCSHCPQCVICRLSDLSCNLVGSRARSASGPDVRTHKCSHAYVHSRSGHIPCSVTWGRVNGEH